MSDIKSCLRFQLLVITDSLDRWMETLLSLSDSKTIYYGDTIQLSNALLTVTVTTPKSLDSLRGCGFHGAIKDSDIDIEKWNEYIRPLIKFR